MCVCALLFICFLHQNILQLWPFSFSVCKASKQNQKPWEKGKESSRKERPLLWKSLPPAFKEKLMDLFLLPTLIEQSSDLGAEMNLEMCWKWISFLCWGFSLKMRLLHLILRNDWLWEKGKKGKHLSYRLTFKLYCLVLARETRLLTYQWSLRGWALHLFLSHTLYPWFRKRLLDSLQNSYPHSALKGGVGELNRLFLDLG